MPSCTGDLPEFLRDAWAEANASNQEEALEKGASLPAIPPAGLLVNLLGCHWLRPCSSPAALKDCSPTTCPA